LAHRPFLRAARMPLLVGVIVLSVLIGSPLKAKQPPAFIVPGPRIMTEEEKSLQPDPSKGSEHGIILATESERDEREAGHTLVSLRFRAKIFSNEGRDLGNVEIPISKASVLQNFWGWTLLPDGTVLELKKEQLKEQMIVDSRTEKIRAMKGSLQGIAPGCVIEYGFQLTQPEVFSWRRVELQSSWPIRTMKHRWFPSKNALKASLLMSRTDRLPIEYKNEGDGSVLVTGKDIPALIEEPYMPPIKEVRGAAIFYYRFGPDTVSQYWNDLATAYSKTAEDFAKGLVYNDYLEKMNIPPGADLPAKLKAVHRWLSVNIKHAEFLTLEETKASEDVKNPKFSAKAVLQSGRAVGRQLDYLYYGFAKLLRAEPYLVLTTDRTDHFYNPNLLSESQFDYSLVAVHLPGEPADKFTFVDTGSGVSYGELPWWVSGSRGFMADAKGAKVIVLRAPDPGQNASETKTKVSFNLEEGSASVRWSRADSGQAGRSNHMELRGQSPEERVKTIEGLCGSQGSFEVTRAEAPGLEDLYQGLHLECEGLLTDTNFTSDLGRYSFRFDGAWEEGVPELTSATRVHPIIFSFPHVDKNVIDIDAPAGFVVANPPPSTKLDSPYGHYALSISATPSGCHVERTFSIDTVGVAATEYEPLRKFLTEVHQADRMPVEFRKAE
jgi:uncharacterized protein DUF3857